MDEARVNQVIKKNDVLLKQMSDLIASQVSFSKRPAEDSASVIREIKKIKTADLVRFSRRRVTKSSIKRPQRGWDSMEDPKYNLEGGNLEAAKSAVDQGITLVKERQKLILLTDKSQYGWKTVQEYF